MPAYELMLTVVAGGPVARPAYGNPEVFEIMARNTPTDGATAPRRTPRPVVLVLGALAFVGVVLGAGEVVHLIHALA